MNGSLVLDTNAVIALQEGIPSVCNFIFQADVLFLPATVLGELLYGALHSANPRRNEAIVWRFVDQSVLVPINENVAVHDANIRLRLKKKGTPIPENDLWIAAVCQERDAPLVTNDIHFTYIDNLKVINWLKR